MSRPEHPGFNEAFVEEWRAPDDIGELVELEQQERKLAFENVEYEFKRIFALVPSDEPMVQTHKIRTEDADRSVFLCILPHPKLKFVVQTIVNDEHLDIIDFSRHLNIREFVVPAKFNNIAVAKDRLVKPRNEKVWPLTVQTGPILSQMGGKHSIVRGAGNEPPLPVYASMRSYTEAIDRRVYAQELYHVLTMLSSTTLQA